MLRTLLESNAPRQQRRGSTVASIAIHTLIIGGAVVTTASANGPASTTRFVTDTVIYISRRPEPRASHPTGASNRTISRRPPSAPTIPNWTFNPKWRPSPPSIELNVGRMLRGDTIPTGGAIRVGIPLGGEAAEAAGGEPATAATVERPAVLRAPPRPRYPDQLRVAGVMGRVVVQLVVDTAGRVEPGSVVIRESSHELFSQAVRAVLPSLRFTPAEVGGRRVRMLVELPFEFRLNE
jgi:periplasmic protein TonB